MNSTTLTTDELISFGDKIDLVTRTNSLTDILDILIERAPIATQEELMSTALSQHARSQPDPAAYMRILAAALDEAAKTVPSGPAH